MAWCLVLFGGDPREHHDGIQPLPLTVALADPALIQIGTTPVPVPADGCNCYNEVPSPAGGEPSAKARGDPGVMKHGSV